MAKLDELKVAVEKGKAKLVPGLVQATLDEGTAPADALAALKDERFSIAPECASKLYVAYAPYLGE